MNLLGGVEGRGEVNKRRREKGRTERDRDRIK